MYHHTHVPTPTHSHTHTYLHVPSRTCAHTHTFTHTHLHVPSRACAHTRYPILVPQRLVHQHQHTCMIKPTHSPTHPHTNTCTYTPNHTCPQACPVLHPQPLLTDTHSSLKPTHIPSTTHTPPPQAPSDVPPLRYHHSHLYCCCRLRRYGVFNFDLVFNCSSIHMCFFS